MSEMKRAAKDVLQETLIRIFKYIHTYEPTGSFEAWMRRIAVRCALTWLDKSCFQKEIELTHHHLDAGMEPEVYQYIGLEAIQQYIDELPLGFRTVFNLNVIEGYSHKEISALLGITESTSRSQLTRARKMLQKKLTQVKPSKYKSA